MGSEDKAVVRMRTQEATTASETPASAMKVRMRSGAFLVFVGLLLMAYWKPVAAVVKFAAQSTIQSYILLIPFICAYLCAIRWKGYRDGFRSGWLLALIPAGVGMAALWAGDCAEGLSPSGQLSLTMFSMVNCFVAMVAGFFGLRFVRAFAFPIFYAYLITPIPEGIVDTLETASKLASAEAAGVFFSISGMPVFREGTIFALPGVVIEVAQECSGIRSSLVLLLTGVLAANLFLRTSWRRALLVVAVVPLGIVRNGFRVFVISKLCVDYGPAMVHSPIHTRGGPLFFALSLIPLLGLLWWLYRTERPKASPKLAGGQQR
jgi:exosortase C (VPDSG-CTERM-specific)